jgi:hypothetical protein
MYRSIVISRWPGACLLTLLFLFVILCSGCATGVKHTMVVTAYCGCSECCSWHRGSWRYLKLNFWNRYVDSGPGKGRPYSGRTASGTKPQTYDPGLISADSLVHPWMIPLRIVFFPWMLLPDKGTIAADTDYYPFGTRMYVPDYGWGVVEDRGSAIKGPNRIDVFFPSHQEALEWGRRRLKVKIVK